MGTLWKHFKGHWKNCEGHCGQHNLNYKEYCGERARTLCVPHTVGENTVGENTVGREHCGERTLWGEIRGGPREALSSIDRAFVCLC